ncbi:SET and MYND domain-containing protein 4 [Cephus cinctus]|uniref:Protein-lysine N-methyltransferase SMYD4 n=1 Tax=Cephus cinctus TaxID=211228 RepID=A0AAJ7FK25_CEPCN|nr:SET and MYND domain-containing protein 4 [Cephus cinctus]XP_015595632.1 SET and MYND domain-containing protein 4 [Cephus cinctus]XP_024941016.1 SET and MYND domain-containing protein 4 [Cephus cinctus]
MDEILAVLSRRVTSANKQHELGSKMAHIKNDDERVEFILTLMKSYGVMPEVISEPKDNQKAKELREQGNKIFVESNLGPMQYITILERYSKSIAYAEINSRELALAYANRSAVLVRVKKYAECVKDIDRALRLDYPDDLKAKLYLRRVECLTALQSPDMQASCDEAQAWLDKLSLDDPMKKKLSHKLNVLYGLRDILVSPEEKEYPLPILTSRNPEVPCAADSVAVKYNEMYGRHVVATRDIKPGEVLAIEKPYTMVLAPENAFTHCANCLKISWASIPCNYCTNVMYCSTACKNDAWKTYHDVECPILDSLLALRYSLMSLCSLKLAVMAVRQANGFDALKAGLKNIDECTDPRTIGFSNDGKFYSNTYQSVYSLVTNSDKRSVADLVGRGLNAAFLTFYLATNTSFFGEKLPRDLIGLSKNKNVIFIGGLILRHQQMIPSNIHSFTEERDLEAVERGAAVMPFLSLLNHCCDSKVTRNSTAEFMVLYALQPIKKGEQIFDNYGVHYSLMPRLARQRKLFKQFFFMCDCEACLMDWETYMNQPGYHEVVSDKKKRAKIRKALQNHSKYIDRVTDGNIDDKNMLPDLLKMIEVLAENVPMPCKDMSEVVETVKRVYALTGNKFDVPK